MICGAIAADGISPYLKTYITCEEDAVMVVAYLGDGSSASLESMWVSPFENGSVGSVAGISTIANMTQATSTHTSKSLINSLLVWEGHKPPEFNLTLHFMAHVDANMEVNEAIKALMQMASPELKAFVPGGRRPKPVVLDIGRRIKITEAVIQSVSFPLDEPKTDTGMFAQSTVSLRISGMSAQNRSDIPLMFI